MLSWRRFGTSSLWPVRMLKGFMKSFLHWTKDIEISISGSWRTVDSCRKHWTLNCTGWPFRMKAILKASCPEDMWSFIRITKRLTGRSCGDSNNTVSVRSCKLPEQGNPICWHAISQIMQRKRYWSLLRTSRFWMRSGKPSDSLFRKWRTGHSSHWSVTGRTMGCYGQIIFLLMNSIISGRKFGEVPCRKW